MKTWDVTWASRRRDHAVAGLRSKVEFWRYERGRNSRISFIEASWVQSTVDRRDNRWRFHRYDPEDQRSSQPANLKPALHPKMRDSLSFTELELEHSAQNDVIDDDAKDRFRVSRILLEKTKKSQLYSVISDSSEQIKWGNGGCDCWTGSNYYLR